MLLHILHLHARKRRSLFWSFECKILRICPSLRWDYLFFSLSLLLVLAEQVTNTVTGETTQAQDIEYWRGRLTPGYLYSWKHFVGRALATIAVLKNSHFSVTMKKQTPDFQERNGIADFSVYTVTFSRCKPFGLGSHLLILLTILWVKFELNQGSLTLPILLHLAAAVQDLGGRWVRNLPQPWMVGCQLTCLLACRLVWRLFLEMLLLSSVLAKECNRVTGRHYILFLSSLSGRRLYYVCCHAIVKWHVINLSVLIWEQCIRLYISPEEDFLQVRILYASGFCILFLFSPSPEVRYTTSDKICSGLCEQL